MIPKRLFTTWISEKEPPELFHKCFQSWMRLMPDYEIKILSLENISHNPWVEERIKNKEFVLVGHYARLEELYLRGGIYLDIDVEAVKRFDELRKNEIFFGAEDAFVVNNAVVGSIPGHSVILEMMNFVLQFDLTQPEKELETGPRMTTAILQEYGWEEGNKTVNLEEIKIYNSKYFYPYHYTERFTKGCIKPETVAIHHWGNSWGKSKS